MKRIREEENPPVRARKAGHSIPARDHLGRGYPSRKAMCDAWGVSPATYGHRRTHGMSVEAALTSPVPDRAARDHTGRKFPTVKAMCDAWGIGAETYCARRNRGMDLETALTAPVHPAPSPALVTDHTGREFPSVPAMCKAWGVNDATYRGRRKRGLDVEDALTAPEAPHPRSRPCADHTGRDFPTVRSMCRAWNVPVSEYYKRVKLGMSIEEALTGPERN